MFRCLSLFLASAIGIAGAAMQGQAAPASEKRCGDDFFYTFQPPSQGDSAWPLNHEGAFVAPDDPGLSVREGLVDAGDFASEIELFFAQKVAMTLIGRAPTDIRDGKIAHPTSPTKSAVLDYPDSQTYMVMIDVQTRGKVLTALMTRSNGKFSKKDIRILKALVASFQYDKKRGCLVGADRKLKEIEIRPREPRRADPERTLSEGQRAAWRAMQGCGVLAQLFVPVVCAPGRLGGSPTIVAMFDTDDRRPAEEHMKTFKEHVTATYCWVARDQKLPALTFAVGGSAEGDPRSVRTYSCKKSDWTKEHRSEELELDPRVFEAL